ncbi:LytR/AlgR family response regulator transcription factor [Runella sp.]|uniref:LytR/AlgR family response regulator transcription factor n=1 Tax=Runella sp. TaxID=1960881 RepID=UPI003D0BD239
MTSIIAQIPVDQIIYLEGNRNYTNICLKNGRKLLSSKNLKRFEELFDNGHFLRVNRSYLVNFAHIQSFEREIMLSNGKIIVPARRKWVAMRILLEKTLMK